MTVLDLESGCSRNLPARRAVLRKGLMVQIRQRLLEAAAIRQDRAVALRRTTLRTETYSLGAIRLYREDLI